MHRLVNPPTDGFRVLRRMKMYAGFVSRVEERRTPKGVLFVESLGGKSCSGGQEKVFTEIPLSELNEFGVPTEG